jgi:hypothetical protein
MERGCRQGFWRSRSGPSSHGRFRTQLTAIL